MEIASAGRRRSGCLSVRPLFSRRSSSSRQGTSRMSPSSLDLLSCGSSLSSSLTGVSKPVQRLRGVESASRAHVSCLSDSLSSPSSPPPGSLPLHGKNAAGRATSARSRTRAKMRATVVGLVGLVGSLLAGAPRQASAFPFPLASAASSSRSAPSSSGHLPNGPLASPPASPGSSDVLQALEAAGYARNYARINGAQSHALPRQLSSSPDFLPPRADSASTPPSPHSPMPLPPSGPLAGASWAAPSLVARNLSVSPAPAHYAGASSPSSVGFVGKQSHRVKLEHCSGLDVFLVSNLPSNLAARYPAFAAREAQEGGGLPLLHHVHLQESAAAGDAKANDAVQRKVAAQALEQDAVANPRVVVEQSRTTPLWNMQSPTDRDGLPVIRIAEGAASVFRMSAPVAGLGDMLSALLEMPVMSVEIHADYSIALSYRLNAAEGRQLHHTHVDAKHRPIADLDLQYLKCRDPLADELEVDLEEAKRHAPAVNVTVWTHGCDPVSFYWKVVCAGNERHLQHAAHGLHIGTPRPAEKLALERGAGDSVSGDFATLSAAARRRRLKLLTQLDGDLVVDGVSTPLCSDVRRPRVSVPKENSFMDFFVWCKGCSTGKVDMHLPSVAADLDVMYPVLHHFHSEASREALDADAVTPGIVPQSHVTAVDIKEGEEDRDVHHFRIDFNCKAEGDSIVALEFLLHGSKAIQVFIRKHCAAPAGDAAPDPVCATGIPSPDGTACCAAKCEVCGGEHCHERAGSVDECCVTHIHARGQFCASKPPPCVIRSLNEDTASAAARTNSALQLAEQQAQASPSVVFSTAHFLSWLAWLLLRGALLLLSMLYLYTVLHRLVILRLPLSAALLPSLPQLFQTGCMAFGALRHFYLSKLQVFTSKRHAYTSFEEPPATPASSWAGDFSVFRPPPSMNVPQFVPLSSLSPSAEFEAYERDETPARALSSSREATAREPRLGAGAADDFEYDDL
ncbi:hypothetical protein BESB_024130 [Besnoitia besnoiti]|uniref:Transmembrane protein n=1 Tax=Besnoitia besnoiti TaxID=94643 RepID=A0A2A9M6I3_BESBE|nr:hypothetical protein BESB_024130 [Besnoitia besnoiti]PFH31921.1 hypothetical protein BESB_024130 [Besnoitia besnoiti]